FSSRRRHTRFKCDWSSDVCSSDLRLRGEEHAWTPESVAKLQHAVRGNQSSEFRTFADSINQQNERLLTIRGLMDFKWAEQPLSRSEERRVGKECRSQWSAYH